MASETLIARLKTSGVEIAAAEDRLVVEAPEGVLTEDLLAEIRRHKQEILATLQQKQSSVADALCGGTTAADCQSLLAADVIAMHLDEFATARLRVEVTSHVLEERIVFASDNAKLDPGERLVVYRAAELKELQGLSPDELRAVHRVKKLFAGTILPS